MRKTWPHNPRGFERLSWNYRCLQLRHALGWSAKKLAKVSGIGLHTIHNIERGATINPDLNTIRRIKSLESAYEDILKVYKKAPVRYNRLHPPKRGGTGVYLNPIKIRRPEDIETLGSVETDSEPMFFGGGTRRKMSQAGMSVFRKARLDRISKASSQRMLARRATGWRPTGNGSKKQSGQPDDK